MKKLTKKSLDELAGTMNVIPEEERDGYWGMYDNDCFWRCVAYLKSDGTAYSEEAAASYAFSYFVNESGYTGINHLSANGAGMNFSDARDYVQTHSHSLKNKILFMNVGENSIGDAWHAVVFIGRGDDLSYIFYDPQNGETFSRSMEDAENISNFKKV